LVGVEFAELLDKLINDSGPTTTYDLEAEWLAGVERARGLKTEQQA
jgi:hypothetical protein